MKLPDQFPPRLAIDCLQGQIRAVGISRGIILAFQVLHCHRLITSGSFTPQMSENVFLVWIGLVLVMCEGIVSMLSCVHSNALLKLWLYSIVTVCPGMPE